MVLASASPRRAALLRAAGFDFEVQPSAMKEWPYAGGDPAEYAEALARAKVARVPGEIVIGADTVVVVDGTVLGKPSDSTAAAAMLRRLSGVTHRVVTGVAVRRGKEVRSGHADTLVTFRVLDEREIREYAASGEPLDKAGAYAYQGHAETFVTRLEGDADTVIGMPIDLLKRLLGGVTDPGAGRDTWSARC